MTISNVQTLHDLAETSLAAYASIQNDRNLSANLLNSNTGANFVTPQATRFTDQYRFRSQQDNVGQNGFSATVFEDKNTGRKVLAIRGTEFTNVGQALADGLVADGLGIGGAGFAYTQTVELVRYWKRLQTPGGQAVQYSEAEAANLFLISAAQVLALPAQLLGPAAIVLARSLSGFDVFRQALMQDQGIDSGTPDLPVIAAGERVDITGHSLGGHLAQVFARIFPNNVNEVVTLNAPTFFTQGNRFLNALGYASSQTVGRLTRIEAEGDGIHLLGNVSYGAVVTIAQENESGPIAAIAGNHSSINSVDSLALLSVIAQLDVRYASNAAGASDLIRAASNRANNSYESTLDSLRRALLGPNILATAVSSGANLAARNDLYTNLQAFAGSAAFNSLAGTVELNPAGNTALATAARTDFSALVALQDLSPFTVRGTTPAANAALAQLWQSTRTSDYAAWQADQALTPAQRSQGLANFSDAYLLDRTALLQGLAAHNLSDTSYEMLIQGRVNANYTYTDISSGQVIRFRGTAVNAGTQADQQVKFGDDRDNSLTGSDADAFGLGDRLYGGAGIDTLSGLGGNDYLEGGSGNDTLDGGSGNDTLVGGSGVDTYQFKDTFGKDTITDSDGLGSIQLDGSTISATKATGQRNVWVAELGAGSGKFAGLAVYDDASSATGKRLVITRDSQDNTITINNFDLTAAQAGGYLGLKLDNKAQSAITSSSTVISPYAVGGTVATSFSKTVAELSAAAFKWWANLAATAGDSITITATNGSNINLLTGNDSISLAQPVTIDLAAGQVQRGFSIVSDTEVDADQTVEVVVSYTHNGETVTSNTLTLTLKNSEETTNTITGDILTVNALAGESRTRASVNGGTVEVVAVNTQAYLQDAQRNLITELQVAQGQIIFGDILVTTNTLYGSTANDKISAGFGNDALAGNAGNDVLDGGDGDDLIAGGAGNDRLTGGDGNDTISSSANLTADQQLGPNDQWIRYGLPAGAQLITSGATWGVYLDASGQRVISGISATPTAEQSDVIDAGAGDDYVIASWGNDRVEGGEGNDTISGLAGDDVLEGGDGDDEIEGDGTLIPNKLSTVEAARHGADFIDGGAGSDLLYGQGGADQVFGGIGNDELYGESRVATNDFRFIPFTYHGADYLDGEDGDDYLEGGGEADTLYGGAGNDQLWGDTSVDNIARPEDNAGAWADDYLDGEEGNDQLVGGGGNDTLYGGIGNDSLFGDEPNLALQGQYHGNDYLDGEDGDDTLEGGGKDDTLYGGAGRDTLFGDARTGRVAGADHGNDYLDGEGDDDILEGGGKDDTLYGGTGNDTLRGDATVARLAAEFHGNDYLDGEDGDDFLEGNGGNDQLYGGAGADFLAGDDDGTGLTAQQNGDDYLDGGDGADTLIGGGGNDTLLGGEGNDFLSGDDDLSNLTPGRFSGDDTLDGGTGNDTLLGGAGNDTLIGGSGNDFLYGSDGDDTLLGGDGDDLLSGGKGRNTLDGGAGNDRYYFRRGDGFASITDSQGFNTLYLEPGIALRDVRFGLGSLLITTGTPGDEIHLEGFDPSNALTTSPLQNIVFQGTGQSYTTAQLLQQIGFDLQGTALADTISGTNLQDRIVALEGDDTVLAFEGNDVVNAGDGDDYVDGGAGDDTLNGDAGIDTLFGGDGNDTLQGGDGDDIMEGGAGNDVLVGGAGNDTYVIDRGNGSDVIDDTQGFSRLQFSGDILASQLTYETFGNDLVIRVAGGDAAAGATATVRNWVGATQRLNEITFRDDATVALTDSIITSVNRPPVAVADSANAVEDGPVVTGNVLTNDSDPDAGNSLSVQAPGSQVGIYGGLQLAATGAYSYTLNNSAANVQLLAQGQNVTETFAYTVQDSNGATATSQLRVTVTGINDAPTLANPIADQSAPQGQAFNYAVAANAFADIDQGDVLSHSAQLISASGAAEALPSWLTFNAATLTFSGTPPTTVSGAYNVRVTVSDGANATASDIFTLTVAATSSGPGDDDGNGNGNGNDDGDDDRNGRSTRGSVITGRDNYDDVLTGTSRNDTIDGNSGNDILNGNAGDDQLTGGLGTDTLNGDGGNDTLVFGADASWRNSGSTVVTTTNAGSNLTVSLDRHERSYDTFSGGNGTDMLLGTQGDDAILLEDPGAASNSAARISGIEIIDGGWGNDIINLSSLRLAYGNVTLIGGKGNDTLWSGAGDDVLQGGEDDDTLDGGAGNDLLQAGDDDDTINGTGTGNDISQGQRGDDIIMDLAGANVLDGGDGSDILTDGDGSSFLFGGKGNDTLTTGTGADLIAFNKGDGSDTVTLGAESTANDILSLGKGIKYADIKFKKASNDLVVDLGGSDQITLKNWYANANNRTVGKLQVVTMDDDSNASSNYVLRNKQVEVFDFAKLVQSFDAARASNASNANGWAVMDSLLNAYLQGSETHALGGDLSSQYARTGSLSGIGLASAQASLATGTDWQTLRTRNQVEAGSIKLA